jgi:alkylation response protein AidB-like acyl-CoA dehydrogenase
VLQAFRHETTDPGLFRAFGDMGLLDSPLPPTYGKAGIGPFGLSEPDYGSDLGGLQTRTQEDMHALIHRRAQSGIQAFTT